MASPESPYIYRILSFDKVVDLFERRALYFSAPEAWPDPFETTFRHRRSHAVFCQCWCKKAVSDAMWRIYSPDTTSVRIRTSKAKLESALRASATNGRIRWFVDDVKYLSVSDLNVRLLRLKQSIQANFDLKMATHSLFLKRDAFDHEAEVRAVIHDEAPEIPATQKHLCIALDPHAFVESIMFDPRANDAFVKVCKFYLAKSVGFKGSVRKSALYRVRQGVVAE